MIQRRIRDVLGAGHAAQGGCQSFSLYNQDEHWCEELLQEAIYEDKGEA